MLFDLIRNGLNGQWYSFVIILMLVPITLISLTVHECAHGLAALRLGDPTAKSRGRLTLDPRSHLDPIGTIMMFLFGFGWAKPVPINPNYFKNRKRGMALTALAGPASNLLMAFVAMFCQHLIYTFAPATRMMYLLYQFFFFFCMQNVGFAVFNLIPVPPLDGSRILNIILPDRYYFKVMQYERYIYLCVVLLLFTGALSRPLSLLTGWIMQLLSHLISLIPGIM